mgnify:CR=1 FL=1
MIPAGEYVISRRLTLNTNDAVLQGYGTLIPAAGMEDYLIETPYFGCVVGRYGNRIDKGRFELDGIAYQLTINDNENHLHGGNKGFDKGLLRQKRATFLMVSGPS